jgi:hypothetical protein
MDAEQVSRFFGHLYDDGAHFEVVAVLDGRARRNTFAWPKDRETVLEALGAFESRGFNLYSSVLSRETQEAGVYDRIWLDRDDPAAPWPFGADPAWDHPAWPSPTTLVRTSASAEGPRWQAIWRLEEPVPEKGGRDVIRQLAKRGIGDESVHDPRRVLRIPGIINAKRDDVSRLLSSSNDRVAVAQFDLPGLAQAEGVTLDRLMNMDVTRPHEVLGEWLNGVGEGDRARKAYVVGRFLKSCGVGFDDALPILVTGARRCDPPLSDSEVVHALRSAYHKD